MLTLSYEKHYFWIFFCSVDKSALHEENPLGLSHGGESSVKDSSEDVFHSDLVGRVKENILPDYTSYMTKLIFSAHASPLQSPCQSSTQGSPTEKEQVSFKQRGVVLFLSHGHVKRPVICRLKCFNTKYSTKACQNKPSTWQVCQSAFIKGGFTCWWIPNV